MRRTILVFAIAVMAIVAGCGEKDNSALVIAKVDTREITIADFEGVSETIDPKYLPETDDLEGKKYLLDHMINKEVMALKALAMGYDKEKWFVDFWPRYKGPYMIAQLMDQKVAQKVVVSEEDVAEYYRQMHIEYTLSQIVGANEDEVAAIRERALAGEDFAELAKKYSLGAGAEHGGYVGANPVGRIHWWVEEELITMEAGDISKPMKTATGWAIIKLHRKRRVEPTQDEEWAAKRVRAVREKKGMEALKAQIEVDIGLQFFTDAIGIAYDGLPTDIPYKDIMSYKINRENAPRLNIPEQFKDKLICQYSDGSYTLGDFEELYYRLALPERPRRQYGREHIVQTIHKQVFDQILPVYAEHEAKILEIPEVRKHLNNKKEMFIVQKLYDDQIKDEVTVTTRDKQDYYAENLEILIKMEMRDFSVIIVPDPKTASEVHKKALEGINFTVLAGKFSTDETSKEDLGRTGLHIKGNMPDYDETGFALDGPGAISDPFQTSRGWAVIKVEEVEDERLPTYAEAEATINKTLLEMKYEE
ncbi:MAG: peptidylprolyl isomerase, partial [Candidatus Krumholzibacteria bacterium]|nr:peptidylprolyl isomerase [Candidatus Krumholzibacteria bacterium]